MTPSRVLCDSCRDLNLKRSDFENPPFEPEGRYKQVILTHDLDSLQHKASTCDLCYLFLQAIKRNEQTQPHVLREATTFEVIWMQSNMEYGNVLEEDEVAWGSALYPKVQHPDHNSNYGVQLVDESDTQMFLRGRAIPSTIDIRMLKGWLERCDREHGPGCADVGLAVPPHPRSLALDFLVIDVYDLRLCQLPVDEAYVTLSYVWGRAAVPKTVTTNVERYKHVGGLDIESLPKTITDAIEVVKALGQQYLWVDALCIVQDHSMKQQLIESMDAVYMHAALCIVASSGSHANAGLSGWSDQSKRADAVPVRSLESGIRLGVLPFFDGELMVSPHAQRAWTFQEGALSTRCLVFHNSLVYYCCRQSIWREDVHTELPGRVEYITGANVLARTLDTYPLHRYGQVVAAYTDRSLSFQSDVLNAFAGIQKGLSRSMDYTRFWCGLPASVFDFALLWQGGYRVTLTRRVEFCSYSWAGWHGTLSFMPTVDGEFDQKWLISRTWIRWYILDTDGQFVLVWDPERDGTTRSELALMHQSYGMDVQTPASVDDESSSHGVNGKNIAENGIANSEQACDIELGMNEVDNDIEDLKDDESDESEIPSTVCPQYGWPTPGNPYGRSSDHPFLTEVSHFKPPEFIPTSVTQLKPGTLCFETYVATFSLHRPSLSTTKVPPESHDRPEAFHSTLYDTKGRLCGAVDNSITDPAYDTQSEVDEHDHQKSTAKLLILSYATPGNKSQMDSWKLKLPPPYESREPTVGDDSDDNNNNSIDGEEWAADEWHTWDMFNVMLVSPKPLSEGQGNAADAVETVVYERVGVGLLHKDALEHALEPVKWTQVFLY